MWTTCLVAPLLEYPRYVSRIHAGWVTRYRLAETRGLTQTLRSATGVAQRRRGHQRSGGLGVATRQVSDSAPSCTCPPVGRERQQSPHGHAGSPHGAPLSSGPAAPSGEKAHRGALRPKEADTSQRRLVQSDLEAWTSRAIPARSVKGSCLATRSASGWSEPSQRAGVTTSSS